jgi:lambda family phage minor tail protein L
MTTLNEYAVAGYWVTTYAEGDANAIPITELQKVAPSSIVELFELQLNVAQHGVDETYRFHAGTNATGTNGDVVWVGNTYQAFPVEAEGFDYTGNGQLPRPKIRVSNIFGTITAIMLNTPLEGAKITRIRTMVRFLDASNFPGGINPTADSTCELPREIYYIDRKAAETRDVVEFELCCSFDLIGVRAPKRQCIANICQWVYKSAECSYTGALPSCTKTLDACKAHFGATAQLPFSSFPGIGSAFF